MARAKNEARETAQVLFFQDYSQKEIAKALNVGEKTVGRWAKEGNWKNRKQSLIISKEQRLQELYEELEELNAQIRSKPDKGNQGERKYRVANITEANIRRGLIKDIKDLETDYAVGEMISIGIDFTNFLKKLDFDLAGKVKEAYDGFINQQITNKKWQK